MGLEEILKQVEETGREKAAAIRKETVDNVESKMKCRVLRTVALV